MDTLSRSPKDAPPPPHVDGTPFVSRRPPTPPPMPQWGTPVAAKRVAVRASLDVSVKNGDGEDAGANERSPLCPVPQLAENRMRPGLPRAKTVAATPNADAKTPFSMFFGLFTPRAAKKEDTQSNTITASVLQEALTSGDASASSSPAKMYDENDPSQNSAVPRELEDLSDIADHIVQETDVDDARPRPPVGRARQMRTPSPPRDSVEVPHEDPVRFCNADTPTKNEPKRRVEIFKRFRFIQDDMHRGGRKNESLAKTSEMPLPVTPTPRYMTRMHVEDGEGPGVCDDHLSFTSGNEDGGEDQARDKFAGYTKASETIVEEKGGLPHIVESVTTSSSDSKTSSDSPSHITQQRVPTPNTNIVSDTSNPFTQAEMPHLRLGKGGVTAHAFMGPSPHARISMAVRQRYDSHAAFLHKKDGSQEDGNVPDGENDEKAVAVGERGTAELGANAEVVGIKRGHSGLQRIREASAGFVNKAKKLPRGGSFTRLREMRARVVAKDEKRADVSDEKDKNVPVVSNADHEVAGVANKPVGKDKIEASPASEEKETDMPEKVKMETGEKKQAKEGKATQETDMAMEVPEYVTIQRRIRRVRRDGSEEVVTKRVRVKPEKVLPNGDVVIKRTMKRVKEDGCGTEMLTVLQVIPRKKKSVPQVTPGSKEAEGNSMSDLLAQRGADRVTKCIDEHDGSGNVSERSGSIQFTERRRSKTDITPSEPEKQHLWRRARSFGKKGDVTSGQRAMEEEERKKRMPRSKSAATKKGDRDTGGLAEGAEGRSWKRKASLPRVLSFQMLRDVRGRRESGSSGGAGAGRRMFGRKG